MRIREKRYAFLFCYSNIRFVETLALICLLLLVAATIFPIAHSTQYTKAASGAASETSLTLSSSNVSMSLTPSANGAFSSSDASEQSTISVTTNNYTGYTLKLAGTGADDTSSRLTNANDEDKYFSSISSALSETSFNTAANNNKWGYKPSKYNSTANTDYLPAPSAEGDVLDKTTAANSDANTYTIALGARADLTNPAGGYVNTFIITATANPIAYFIIYDSDTTDAIDNMPPDQSASDFTGTSIALDTKEPTRNIHLFQGWCTSSITNNSTTSPSCTGTTYQPGAEFPINQTTTNNITLKAIWKLNAFNVTINSNNTSYGTVNTTSLTNVPYGTTLPATGTTSASITINGTTITATPTTATAQYTYSFTGWTHSCGTTLTSACTITANFTRLNNYTITINSNNTDYGTVSPASLTIPNGTALPSSGATTTSITIGGSTITATAKSGYLFKNWTHSCGATLTGACTITANFESAKTYMQDFTLANCQAQASSGNLKVYDKRDENDYTVRYINNQCWMTQNLRFTGASISSDTTNAPTTTLTYYQLDTNGSSQCNSTNGYNNACIKDSGDTTKGVWYNYYAATAGTISGSENSTAATQDICPKGWHLPSGPNTTSGTDFNKLVGNTTSGWQNPTTGLTAFGAVSGGLYLNGSLYDTGSGYWWSATAINTTVRYSLGYYSSSGQFNGSGGNYRYIGYFVRCVRSS